MWVERPSVSRRATAAFGAVALEGLILYAMIFGFALTLPAVREDRMKLIDILAPPPPRPVPRPRFPLGGRRGGRGRDGLGPLHRRGRRPCRPLCGRPLERQPAPRRHDLPPDPATLPLPALARPFRPPGSLSNRRGPQLDDPGRSRAL